MTVYLKNTHNARIFGKKAAASAGCRLVFRRSGLDSHWSPAVFKFEKTVRCIHIRQFPGVLYRYIPDGFRVLTITAPPPFPWADDAIPQTSRRETRPELPVCPSSRSARSIRRLGSAHRQRGNCLLPQQGLVRRAKQTAVHAAMVLQLLQPQAYRIAAVGHAVEQHVHVLLPTESLHLRMPCHHHTARKNSLRGIQCILNQRPALQSGQQFVSAKALSQTGGHNNTAALTIGAVQIQDKSNRCAGKENAKTADSACAPP